MVDSRTSEQLTAADYEEVLADHRRLVRELDVLLNGEAGAAKQASLCDIVGQLAAQKRNRSLDQCGICPDGLGICDSGCDKNCRRALERDGLIAPRTSKQSPGVRAGNAFVAKFKREPTEQSDCAWLNGYAQAVADQHAVETPPLSSKDGARSLRELADELPKKPVHLGQLQQALRGGAAEIEQLRARVLPVETPTLTSTHLLVERLRHWSREDDADIGHEAANALESADAVNAYALRKITELESKLSSETPALRLPDDPQDLLVTAAQDAGFSEYQWKAMFYEQGPYDVTFPCFTTKKFIALLLERLQAKTPAALDACEHGNTDGTCKACKLHDDAERYAKGMRNENCEHGIPRRFCTADHTAKKTDAPRSNATHYECAECGGAVPHGQSCSHNLHG